MEIIKTKNDGKLTLALDGRLDTNTAPELEAAFKQEAADTKAVVLDLSKLAYLSSAGLRVVLTIQKTMKSVNGSLVVKNVNETIMEVFEITGFSDILTIE